MAAFAVLVLEGDVLMLPAVTLLILTVPWLLLVFAMLLGLFYAGLTRVLLRGAGVASLPLLTQPLLFDDGAARLFPFAYVGARPFCKACVAIVFFVPRRTVRWFLFYRRDFGSRLLSNVFAT